MISIIIPTLNEESVIGKTLQYLKSSIHMPNEVIVSDGKSTDKTVEIARKYADKVVEYSGTKRQTIAQGRNDGAKQSNGEFLLFMDADCTIDRVDEALKYGIERLEKEPNLVAITPRIKVFPENETFGDKIGFGLLDLSKRINNNLFHRGESGGEFQLMRRKDFDRLGGFREDLVTREDGDMFLRLSRIGRTSFDPSITVYHTGRRAHKIGWGHLMWIWMLNTVWVMLFDKAHAEEWKVIR